MGPILNRKDKRLLQEEYFVGVEAQIGGIELLQVPRQVSELVATLQAQVVELKRELSDKDEEKRLLRAAIVQLETSLVHREKELRNTTAFLGGKAPPPPGLDWVFSNTPVSKLKQSICKLQIALREKQDDVDRLCRREKLTRSREAEVMAEEYYGEARRLSKELARHRARTPAMKSNLKYLASAYAVQGDASMYSEINNSVTHVENGNNGGSPKRVYHTAFSPTVRDEFPTPPPPAPRPLSAPSARRQIVGSINTGSPNSVGLRAATPLSPPQGMHMGRPQGWREIEGARRVKQRQRRLAPGSIGVSPARTRRLAEVARARAAEAALRQEEAEAMRLRETAERLAQSRQRRLLRMEQDREAIAQHRRDRLRELEEQCAWNERKRQKETSGEPVSLTRWQVQQALLVSAGITDAAAISAEEDDNTTQSTSGGSGSRLSVDIAELRQQSAASRIKTESISGVPLTEKQKTAVKTPLPSSGGNEPTIAVDSKIVVPDALVATSSTKEPRRKLQKEDTLASTDAGLSYDPLESYSWDDDNGFGAGAAVPQQTNDSSDDIAYEIEDDLLDRPLSERKDIEEELVDISPDIPHQQLSLTLPVSSVKSEREVSRMEAAFGSTAPPRLQLSDAQPSATATPNSLDEDEGFYLSSSASELSRMAEGSETPAFMSPLPDVFRKSSLGGGSATWQQAAAALHNPDTHSDNIFAAASTSTALNHTTDRRELEREEDTASDAGVLGASGDFGVSVELDVDGPAVMYSENTGSDGSSSACDSEAAHFGVGDLYGGPSTMFSSGADGDGENEELQLEDPLSEHPEEDDELMSESPREHGASLGEEDRLYSNEIEGRGFDRKSFESKDSSESDASVQLHAVEESSRKGMEREYSVNEPVAFVPVVEKQESAGDDLLMLNEEDLIDEPVPPSSADAMLVDSTPVSSSRRSSVTSSDVLVSSERNEEHRASVNSVEGAADLLVDAGGETEAHANRPVESSSYVEHPLDSDSVSTRGSHEVENNSSQASHETNVAAVVEVEHDVSHKESMVGIKAASAEMEGDHGEAEVVVESSSIPESSQEEDNFMMETDAHEPAIDGLEVEATASNTVWIEARSELNHTVIPVVDTEDYSSEPTLSIDIDVEKVLEVAPAELLADTENEVNDNSSADDDMMMGELSPESDDKDDISQEESVGELETGWESNDSDVSIDKGVDADDLGRASSTLDLSDDSSEGQLSGGGEGHADELRKSGSFGMIGGGGGDDFFGDGDVSFTHDAEEQSVHSKESESLQPELEANDKGEDTQDDNIFGELSDDSG